MIKYRLELKVILLYFIVIVVIIGMYFKTFQYVYNEHEKKLISEESIATLQTIQTAVTSTIKNANDFSKLVLSDEVVQKVIGSGDLFGNISDQSALSQRIYAQSQFSDVIGSVWFIDLKNQTLSIGNKTDAYSLGEIKNMSWYQSVLQKDGKYQLVTSGEGDNKTVSLIRVYKNLENFETIGFYGINIKIDALRATYLKALDVTSEEVLLYDDTDQIICNDGNSIVDREELEQFLEQLSLSKTGTLTENKKIKSGGYLITGVTVPKEGWKMVRILPLDIRKNSTEILKSNILLMLVSGGLILLGSVIISRAITMPIQSVLLYMKQAEDGKFVKIQDSSFFKEFVTLFEGYNLMIEKMDLLIQQTIEKQKRIRKVELNQMQQQMKPHFLYNTLDSIDALAMLGENQKVCELVGALGDFYRKSVSKGREMLTLAEEVKIVEDYISIMKIRFRDSFVEEMKIDTRCLRYLLPKLTLQPLVENAFQHGIRGKEELGHIFIGASLEETKLHIWIKDNGKGIPNSILSELRKKEKDKEEAIYRGEGFGLYGTIERMELIYGDQFSYYIQCEGDTEIHFYIEIDGMKEEVENGILESYFG